MKTNLYLLLSASLLTLIGGFIAINPLAYLEQFSSNPSLPISFYSELRAFGSGLLGVGFIAGLSLILPKLKKVATVAATLIFSSYFLGRLMSLSLDGLPRQEIFIAAGIELTFSMIGLYLLNQEVES